MVLLPLTSWSAPTERALPVNNKNRLTITILGFFILFSAFLMINLILSHYFLLIHIDLYQIYIIKLNLIINEKIFLSDISELTVKIKQGRLPVIYFDKP